MAPSVYVLYILVIKGFLSVHCNDKTREQTGLYFIEEPRDVIGVRGESVMLPCSAGSTQNREIKLIWLHDSSPIMVDARRQLLSNGSLLLNKIIHKKVGYSDQGEYRCIISDGNGYLSSKSVYLRISVMRNFTEHPRSQTVREGSHVRMSCQIDSVPDAVITWDRDDEILSPQSSRHVILSGSGVNGSVIYLFNVRHEDAGKYRCTAKNPLTENRRQSKRAVLTVSGGIGEKQGPQRFLSDFSVKTVKEGDDVVLDCAVDDFPFPVLFWTYKRKGVGEEVSIFNSTASGYNMAHLKNVRLHNSGLYNCRSLNDSLKELVTEVRVMTRPEFKEQPETVTYQAARAVRFRCKVIGNPVPVIKWVKDGFLVNITGRITQDTKVNITLGLRTSEIVVASSLASDAGIYQCIAKNPVGMISSASRLILNSTKPAPIPPEQVSCKTISSTEIGVEWEVSDDRGLKAFTIHYHDLEGGEELREAAHPTNRSIVIRSLIPYTNYTFYLRSYSDSASDFSKQVICRTSEEAPEASPDIQLISSSPHTLHISWSPLTKFQARGKVIEYKIQWRLHGTPSINVHRLKGDVLEYTITDLLPTGEYEVRALAATSKGWANSDAPWKTFKLPGTNIPRSLPEPSVQLQAINSTVIKVMWSFSNDFNADLRGYKLFYFKENSSFPKLIILPPNASNYYLTNLDAETVYRVTVLGFTEEVEGKSGSNLIRTLPNANLFEETHTDETPVIEPPVGLQAEPTSRGIINLSWNPAPSPTIINYYTICYNPVQANLAANKSSISCLQSEKTNLSISNLEPYTLYEFKVRSHSVDKYSDYSQSVECYTVEDVPSPVVDIKWKAENKTTVFTSWRQPKRTNGIIRNYTIFYTKDSTLPLPSWTTKVVSADTYKAHLTDLTPNIEYSMIIRASTSAGLGSYEHPEQVTIPIPMGTAGDKTTKTVKNRRNEQYVGIVVGLGIGLICIIICTFCIICRRRCTKNQAPEEIEPSSVSRNNGNSCQTERDPRVNSQETEFFSFLSSQNSSNDGASGELHLDKKPLSRTQVRYQNGFSNGVGLSLLAEGKTSKDTLSRAGIRITENPRYDDRFTESPLLERERISSNSTLNNGFTNDSEIPNHLVPLLVGKQKFTDPESLEKVNNEDSESELEERKRKQLKNQEQGIDKTQPKKELLKLTDNPSSFPEKYHKSNHSAKENRILENPDFRFSDSLASQLKKNGYFIPQKFRNGATNPLLQTHIRVESSGI